MDDNEQVYEVGREHKGLSLLDFLEACAGPFDHRLLMSALREGHVLLNGVAQRSGATLRLGDQVQLTRPVDQLESRRRHPVTILHEDDELLVADKPSGLPFAEGRRPGASALGTLGEGRTGLRAPHRLDKDTSGLVVAALGKEAGEALEGDFRVGRARVEYLAIVRGALDGSEGRIDVPLGKARKSDARLVPDPDHGEPAATCWRLQEALRGFLVLRLWCEEGGRSHQVRAHLGALGVPALCDKLYGEDDRLLLSQIKLDYRPKRGRPERPLLQRPALHAVEFKRGPLRVTAPLPEDLSVLLAQLRRQRPLA